MTQRSVLQHVRRLGLTNRVERKCKVSMHRIARIKHRCRQHNKETVAENNRHFVTVEKEDTKCSAQTRPFDEVTNLLDTTAHQTNWMMRIQQLKNEMDVEQQGRVGDTRSLMALQANSPKESDEDADADQE